VLEPSLEEFANRLERHWENSRRLAKVNLAGRSEIDLGQTVLANCMDYQVQLQGMEVPSYFIPGSYHALSDGLRIGWHPRFDALLVPTPEPVTRTDRDVPTNSAGNAAGDK